MHLLQNPRAPAVASGADPVGSWLRRVPLLGTAQTHGWLIALSIGLTGTVLAAPARARATEDVAASSSTIPYYEISLDLAANGGHHRETVLVPSWRVLRRADGRGAPPETVVAGDVLRMERHATARVIGVAPHPETRPSSGRGDSRRVTAVIEHDVTSLVTVRSAHESVETTPEHPFFIHGKGWTPAAKLGPGDGMIGAYGDEIPLLGMEERKVPLTRVHNLVVEGVHTYRVGGQGLLVHNTGLCGLSFRLFKRGKRSPAAPDAPATEVVESRARPVMTLTETDVAAPTHHPLHDAAHWMLDRTLLPLERAVAAPVHDLAAHARLAHLGKLKEDATALQLRYGELSSESVQLNMKLADALGNLEKAKSRQWWIVPNSVRAAMRLARGGYPSETERVIEGYQFEREQAEKLIQANVKELRSTSTNLQRKKLEIETLNGKQEHAQDSFEAMMGTHEPAKLTATK